MNSKKVKRKVDQYEAKIIGKDREILFLKQEIELLKKTLKYFYTSQ